MRQTLNKILFLMLVFLLVGASDAMASHLRMAHVTWQKVGPTTVNITFRTAWRTNLGDRFNLGDDTLVPIGTVVSTLTDLSGASYNVYENHVTHTYAHAGPWTIQIDSCCRIGGLVNANGSRFRVLTSIDLRGSQMGSSIASIPPIIQWPQGPNSLNLSVLDPDGPVTCRMSTNSESRIPSLATAGGNTVSVSNNCVLSWDATSAPHAGRYAVQVMLQEGSNPDTGQPYLTALDFIVEINGNISPNDPPTCVLNGSPTNELSVGQPFSISATGTDPEGSNLTVNYLNLPPGASVSPPQGGSLSSPATASLNWVPATAGVQSVSFLFTDDQNQQVSCSFSADVSANDPPIADAGPDQVVEQASAAGADVTLDGSGSSDPNSDPLTYSWTGPFGTATGVSPTVSMPPGTHTVTLVVNDGDVDSDPDTMIVTVQDTTAPTADVSCLGQLWPPNHKLVVATTVSNVSDAVDADPDVSITVTSNQPLNDTGDGNTDADWEVSQVGNDWVVKVRAERAGNIDGPRIYTVTVTITDDSGNVKVETCEVVVPHDQRGKKK